MSKALRILVVEDEMLVSMLVEDMLEDLGHVPIGPAARLDAGVRLANSETLDLAILDINLGGTKSFPIADVLIARGVPVIFATGYGASGLDQRFLSFPVIAKPFSEAVLKNAIYRAAAA
jgi:DNA-binding response OmpR family regulator